MDTAKIPLIDLINILRRIADSQDPNTETNVVEVRIHNDPGTLWRTIELQTTESTDADGTIARLVRENEDLQTRLDSAEFELDALRTSPADAESLHQ